MATETKEAIEIPLVLKPWVAPVRRPAVAVSRAVEPSIAVTTDTSSVRYLGTLTRDGEGKTYLFKYLLTGTVLTLNEQQENQGWAIQQITKESFTLKGPGGLYVVTR